MLKFDRFYALKMDGKLLKTNGTECILENVGLLFPRLFSFQIITYIVNYRTLNTIEAGNVATYSSKFYSSSKRINAHS